MRVRIEKIVFGGQGFGHAEDGRAAFLWNALPGEEVECESPKRIRGVYEGIATSIVSAPSSARVPSTEEHFLSCSPWQIISEEGEAFWKRATAREAYQKIGGFDPGELLLESDSRMWGYRNKMEFSFTDDQGDLSLALYRRGTKQLVALDGCALAISEINTEARAIVQKLRHSGIASEQLKSLIVRSNQRGNVITALFVKDRALELPSGVTTYYSDPRSPASRPDELLQKGVEMLEEEVSGVRLKYGALSFFQVNVPVFSRVIEDIRPFVKGEDIIDYYSGVGTIGLALKGEWRSCELVEENEEAVRFAQENIELNAVKECVVSRAPAEKMRDIISPDKVVICDPPRVGLHPKITERLLEAQPKRIVYLSCNPSTQARDIKELFVAYDISFLKLYNFFPRTAHCEALAVLNRKSKITA